MAEERKKPESADKGKGSKAVVSVLAITLLIVASASLLFSGSEENYDDDVLGANGYTPMIAAGINHTLALKDDGTVWAWGRNNYGQLGNGTTVDSSTPVRVSDLTGMKAVAIGFDFSLALKDDGTVWAWGGNQYGQLGNGTNGITANSSTPVQVSDLTGVKAIAAGHYHSLALVEDGTVWAWGFNSNGQLGNGFSGSSIEESTPVQVSGMTDVKSIAGGYFYSLAIKENGTVWAWGRNNYGQLGDGTKTDRSIPVQVSDLTNVRSITAGNNHSLAIKENGTAWSWGRNNYGQLGDGTRTDRSIPVRVPDLTSVKAIAAGNYHSLALKENGTVWAWGGNEYGQLGNGISDTGASTTAPVQISDMTGVKSIAAGYYYTLALKDNGTVWACGHNNYGQLGDGTAVDKKTLTQIGPFSMISPDNSSNLLLIAAIVMIIFAVAFAAWWFLLHNRP